MGDAAMTLRTRILLTFLGLLGMATGANPLAGQTLELKSVQLAALKGAEQDRFVAAHNAARKGVKVDPLVWSDDLTQAAARWLAEEQDRVIEEAKEGWASRKIVMPDHRADGRYGENIAGWAGTKVPGAERAVAFWLSEKEDFDRLNASGSFRFGDQEGRIEVDAQGKERPLIVGHYTAMVWRATTHLGAAKLVFQLADDRGTVRTYVAVFCNYSPPGNIRGEQPF
jgi:pathogenesis-related protein 1